MPELNQKKKQIATFIFWLCVACVASFSLGRVFERSRESLPSGPHSAVYHDNWLDYHARTPRPVVDHIKFVSVSPTPTPFDWDFTGARVINTPTPTPWDENVIEPTPTTGPR